ncbi:MAG: type II toxin-antitoxin system RelE/ParE family toxin [Ignavibacteriae bacterium]|nr:type II toxin-antitoxin system RelE/ParE family toxin [Ignavibacteriota bacterium]
MHAELPLRYLPIAQEDLLHICEFIASDSPSRANTFINVLDRRIGALSGQPRPGRMPRHPHLRSMGYRVLVVGPYLVFYLIRSTHVEIHRIIHTSRDLDHLL